MKRKLNVGMIGYKFMGKAHSHAYQDVNMFFKTDIIPVKKVICGRNEKALKEAKETFGWEEYETDWKKVIERKDIDIIDINTPNYLHKDIALKAAGNKKIIFCEKPLAMNTQEAKEMLDAVKKNKVRHMVAFNYRKLSAVALLKKFIEDGKLGKIYHFRAVYLQDWITDRNFPLVWRLQKKFSGSGVHGDLNSHIIDLARYLVGEFESVVGLNKTFINERYLLEEEEKLTTGLQAKSGKKKGKVDVDDTTLFLAKFKNGAVGSFESTRFAPGRRNYQRIEINGSKGSAYFELEHLNILWFYSCNDPKEEQGFKRIQVTESCHPYAGAWWPAGHIIGWEHSFIHLIADLLSAIEKDKIPSPNFEDGLKCQIVLDAVEESIKKEKWIKIGG